MPWNWVVILLVNFSNNGIMGEKEKNKFKFKPYLYLKAILIDLFY